MAASKNNCKEIKSDRTKKVYKRRGGDKIVLIKTDMLIYVRKGWWGNTETLDIQIEILQKEEANLYW